jgi:hypothetical protein
LKVKGGHRFAGCGCDRTVFSQEGRRKITKNDELGSVCIAARTSHDFYDPTAGLDFYYCCEPIGPEHSSEELVDQLFLGIELGCFQHAALRRVYIPNSPLASRGQISELRLAQITAVVALASLACPDIRNIAIHEPNLIGLTSGANVVYAEMGANPRDTIRDTTVHRGRNIKDCKSMLYEAGFDYILTAPAQKGILSNIYKEP